MTKLTNQPTSEQHQIKKKSFYKIPWFTTLEWIFKPRAASGFNNNSNINNNYKYYYYNYDNNNNNNNIIIIIIIIIIICNQVTVRLGITDTPMIYACGVQFRVDHAMVWQRGRFIIQRHNELRALEAEMLATWFVGK